MRRFITLMDALYEAHVRLVVLSSAADDPFRLAADVGTSSVGSQDEGFAFARAASRIVEMTSISTDGK